MIKLEILLDGQMSSDPGWVFCLSERSVIFTSLYLFIVTKNNTVIQFFLKKKWTENTLNHHSLAVKYSLLSFQMLTKCCGAAELSGSDGRAPQGPRVCVPVWDQGTASMSPSSTVTLKTAGHRRSSLLPFPSPQPCGFQRGCCFWELILQIKALPGSF